MSEEEKDYYNTYGLASNLARIKNEMVQHHNKLITMKQDKVVENYQVHPYLVNKHTLGRRKKQPEFVKAVANRMLKQEEGKFGTSYRINGFIKKGKVAIQNANMEKI